ncbi:hypothetical protein QUB80_02900 [Chlorogloeopsis sp. ULAP01]|uniref:hypothetical protein n=1 Tax=Chlorogloeopsis sp. ULAP01 TaxID=3056483 RepID=UPI0025AA483F|nr:hypothetical protein [Chlorogloeopsis sp. ULAP01]MDM9379651.1 hypothetical protein [Chlorogloeopsis sp. ULAP01]
MQMETNLTSTASGSDTTIIDSALTMAQFAGFALGPEGLIVAGGAAILQTIFHSLLSSEQKTIPIAEQLDKVLTSELTAEKIRESLASFKQTYAWFREYYENAWNEDLDDSAELKDFEANLNLALGPNSNFLFFITLLEDPEYDVVGFTAFLLGASLHIVLLKVDLIIKSSSRQVKNTPALQVLIDTLGEYVDQANNTNTKIQGEISKRIGQVTDVQQNNGNYSFTDKGKGPNGTVYNYNDEESAKIGREAALELLQAQLNLKYYHGRPDKAQATINEWKSTKTQYEGYKDDSNT